MGLAVSDLALDRAGRRVIEGLSFELAAGRALVLLGPNGAGKSTLLRALAGLLPAAAGRIALDGADLAADRDAWAERVAYAGHLDAVKPQLGLRENLAFWAALCGAPSAAAEAALADVGLASLAERRAHACSAGQKRRLGLARLLLAPRRLWLLDEPTVSLDADAADRLAGQVRAHCAAGGLAVVATHVGLDLGPCDTLELLPPGPCSARSRAADPFLAGPLG